MTKRAIKWFLIVACGFGFFFFVDIPYTVRLKSLIVNSLPLAPENKLSIVRSMCSAAFPYNTGATLGYQSNFESQAAAHEVEKKKQCAEFKQSIAPGGKQENEWLRTPDGSAFYKGTDTSFENFMFVAQQCVFLRSSDQAIRVFRGLGLE